MNWFITDTGDCQSLEFQSWEPTQPYRLYRFLTELEDILKEIESDRQRLEAIAPRVCEFLETATWLDTAYVPPDPKRGWSVSKLYTEQDYPLTVQLVSWKPGAKSTIHNHATWGLVAMLSGCERNRFWRRTTGDAIEEVGNRIVCAGELITFSPGAIHQIEVFGDEPTISFNLYGETDFPQRFQFDAIAQTAENF
ncbi:cupin [Geitlerinema sp. P-1104]|uniref:cysteine dioxygenase family protein n=1 Tax=Geitlerinema sp. P-1104 TaxID=2546230 RepID=UPI0014776C69|nr:cupin [Geitlerinema sp. P-1104]NMG57105.1 cupin [Geitlerinema sp. P-1104]